MTASSAAGLRGALAAVRSGRTRVSDLVDGSLARAVYGRDLNVFTHVLDEDARARAARLDRDGAGPLRGMTLAVKNNIDVAGLPTTSGAWQGTVPAVSAPIVAWLERLGAAVIGLTNMHAWGCGVTSAVSRFGPVRNPWNRDVAAGGSSGGSATAVALGATHVALGSDTGGSIRIPASWTGTVGFKPTAARLPRQGLAPISWLLDTIGLHASTVDDVRTTWAALHPRRSAPSSPPTFVVDRSWIDAVGGDAACVEAVDTAAHALRRAGHRVEAGTTGLDAADLARAQTVLSLAHLAELHDPGIRTHPERYGAAMRRLVARGAAFDDADLAEARELRSEARAALRRALPAGQVLLLPATGALPPALAPDSTGACEPEPPAGVDAYAYPANLLDLAALVQPVGEFAKGIPLAVQLMGADEDVVLSAASALEKSMKMEEGLRPAPDTAASGRER